MQGGPASTAASTAGRAHVLIFQLPLLPNPRLPTSMRTLSPTHMGRSHEARHRCSHHAIACVSTPVLPCYCSCSSTACGVGESLHLKPKARGCRQTKATGKVLGVTEANTTAAPAPPALGPRLAYVRGSTVSRPSPEGTRRCMTIHCRVTAFPPSFLGAWLCSTATAPGWGTRQGQGHSARKDSPTTHRILVRAPARAVSRQWDIVGLRQSRQT